MRRAHTLSVVVIVTVLLAACTAASDTPNYSTRPVVPASSISVAPSTVALSSGTPAPPTSGTASATPTATPSRPSNTKPGERPPVFPDAAKQHTANGALAFADYFLRALDWSGAVTDPALLIPISGPACQTCNYNISGLRQLRATGGYVIGGRAEIQTVDIADPSPDIDADASFRSVIRIDKQTVVEPGKARRTVAGEVATIFVYVSWISNRWQVAELVSPVDK